MVALARACLGSLLLLGAAATDIFFFASGASFGSADGADHTIVQTFGDLAGDGTPGAVERPEWCTNETDLTWAQRRQRLQQQDALRWAKQEARKMRDANQTVPRWMDKMLSEDENRGRLKWAAQESKRLAQEGREVPGWMQEMAAESAKWANRWAACKACELRAAGEEVPQWMEDNGRRGIVEFADEKVHELQAQINELEEEKSREEALVSSGGDVRVAWQRMLAGNKATRMRSVTQQLRAVEDALAELSEAEKRGDTRGPRMAQLAIRVRKAYSTLGRVIEHRSAKLWGRA